MKKYKIQNRNNKIFHAYIRGASKIKLSSSVQNSEGGGDGKGGDNFADPCQEFKQGFLRFSSGLPFV